MRIRERAAAFAASAADPQTAGTYVVYGAAVFASLGTLDQLAQDYAGWNAWMAPFFAIIIDIYWLTAFHAALDRSLPFRKRIGAAAHGFTAIAFSVWCNILYHELHQGIWHLGHGGGALLAGGTGSATLLVAGAIAHLRSLSRKARPDRPRARTAPASHPAQPPRTAPAGTGPSQPSAPDHPAAPPRDEGATAPAAEGSGGVLPRELKAGGRPDPVALAKARDIYVAGLRSGTIHNRRTLMAAVNEHYGRKVIGETSASAVIDEHRSKRTA
jgi:hypothetical protein